MRNIILLLCFLSFLSVCPVTAQITADDIQNIRHSGLRVIDIQTVNDELPTCDYAEAPEGSMGYTCINQTKVPCRVIITHDDQILYDSGDYENFKEFVAPRTVEKRSFDATQLTVVRDPQTNAIVFLETYLKKRTGVCWDRQALEYALEEHRLFRGRYAANAHAFAATEGETCHIISVPNDLAAGVALLRQMTQEDRVKLILPPDAPLGETEDGGMFLAFRPTDLGEAFLCFAKE